MNSRNYCLNTIYALSILTINTVTKRPLNSFKLASTFRGRLEVKCDFTRKLPRPTSYSAQMFLAKMSKMAIFDQNYEIDRILNKLAFLRCLFFVKSEIILKDYNGSSPDKSLTSAYT